MTWMPAAENLPTICPECAIAVTLRIDRYGCCLRHGGCGHIAELQRVDGALRVGFESPCLLEHS